MERLRTSGSVEAKLSPAAAIRADAFLAAVATSRAVWLPTAAAAASSLLSSPHSESTNPSRNALHAASSWSAEPVNEVVEPVGGVDAGFDPPDPQPARSPTTTKGTILQVLFDMSRTLCTTRTRRRPMGHSGPQIG